MKQRNLKDAFTPMPSRFEARIHYTMAHMEELTMQQKRKLKTGILVAALMLALTGVAFAAALQWGTLDFLLPGDERPEGSNVEALGEMITPIGETHAGEGYTLTLVDALFDGTNISLAWTLENTGDETLFHFADTIVLPDGNEPMQRMFTAGAIAVEPGKTHNFGAKYTVSPQAPGGTSLAAAMPFTIARATGPITIVNLPDAVASEMTEAERADYEAMKAEENRKGVLIVENGAAQVPEPRDAEKSAIDNFLAAGLMDVADTFQLDFILKAVAETISALPDGVPIEKRLDGYTIRVTRAEVTQNTTHIEMEYVFDDEESMLALAKSRDWVWKEDDGREIMLPFVSCYIASLEAVGAFTRGESEEPPFIQGFSASTYDVHQRGDGKWVVPLSQEAMTYGQRPEVITILPVGYRGNGDEEAEELYYPEDAMELRFTP